MKRTVARAEERPTPRNVPQVGPCDDLKVLIAKRAFELYHTRGCQEGRDLDDWLEAEREILSQVPPV
jgi:hypothetical protein